MLSKWLDVILFVGIVILAAASSLIIIEKQNTVVHVKAQLVSVTYKKGMVDSAHLVFKDANNTTYATDVDADLYTYYKQKIGEWFILKMDGYGHIEEIREVRR